jgi:hypothetical protein
VRCPNTKVFGHKPGLISLASLNLTLSSPPSTPIQCIPCSGVITAGRVFLDASIDFVAVLPLTASVSQRLVLQPQYVARLAFCVVNTPKDIVHPDTFFAESSLHLIERNQPGVSSASMPGLTLTAYRPQSLRHTR